MAYWVYILQSEKDDSYYIGHTSDLEGRIQRHNRGRSPYTKAKLPWRLIYREEFHSRSETMKRRMKLRVRRVELTSKSWLERPEFDSGRLSRLKAGIAPARMKRG